jgi:cytoskeletal protein CcmA (bactofilin family)
LISGTVYSNVDVIDKLELTATAKLFGDIKTGTLIIDEGAVFKGACEMRRGNEPEPIFKEGKSSVPKS